MRFYSLCASTVSLLALISFFIGATPALAASSSQTSWSNLEKDFGNWHIFHDQGYTNGSIKWGSIEAADPVRKPLAVLLSHGQPYAGIHAFHDLPSSLSASSFTYSLDFYIDDMKPVQALEFTNSKWLQNTRWEWAVQWQAIPDGSSTAALAQSWRLWTGSQWSNVNLHQPLKAHTWHHLTLQGSIINNRVQYQKLSCDNLSASLADYRFDPVSSPDDKLAVGVQLDGDALETPYQVYLSNIKLTAY